MGQWAMYEDHDCPGSPEIMVDLPFDYIINR